MQLVLNSLEEGLCDFSITAVVDTALLVEVRDLQVEAPLTGPDGANAFQQFIEIVFAKASPLLQALVIQDESLDEELTENTCRPNAKLGRLALLTR